MAAGGAHPAGRLHGVPQLRWLLCGLLALCLLLGTGLARAQAETPAGPPSSPALQPVPPLTARVVDLTGTLDGAQRARLEARLAALEGERGAQVAVLLVPTTRPESVEAYALRVAETWRLGRKGIDDGALLLVAKEDRSLRIEVGYGLEGALNDATASRIIRETIVPAFRSGDFAGGIDAGVDAMLRVIGGEPLPPPAAPPVNGLSGDTLETLVVGGLALVFGIGGVLRAMLGRFLAALVIGTIAGVLASFFVASTLAAVGIGLLVFIVGLFAGSGTGLPGSGGRGGWGGGGSGRSGGFSGGGGSFGGGGASGRW